MSSRSLCVTAGHVLINMHSAAGDWIELDGMRLKIQLDPTTFNCVIMLILLKSSKSHPTLQVVSSAPGGQIFSASKLPNTNQHLKGSRSLHKPRNFTGKYYSIGDKKQLNENCWENQERYWCIPYDINNNHRSAMVCHVEIY